MQINRYSISIYENTFDAEERVVLNAYKKYKNHGYCGLSVNMITSTAINL